MRRWDISSSKDGYAIVTYVKPWYAVAVEWAYDNACWLSRGWIGGHGMPDYIGNVSIGRRKYDAEHDILDSSIAMRLYDMEQRLHNWTYRKETERIRIPVSDGVAELINPELVKLMKEIHGDD